MKEKDANFSTINVQNLPTKNKSFKDRANEERIIKKTALFEADFNVYADRGNNCYKPSVMNDIKNRN